jgi:peptide chain release factor subunit 3
LLKINLGHVDSGKSTLAGNMLIHTGMIDEDELRKYEQEAKANDRESWMIAYVMDINEEEKEKGKTVEVGKASFETKDKRYVILDCPGHRNYVPNMIAGATQADVAALVVSAKSGEFEAGFERGGQTMEHTILARYLGSEYLVIIINKMDECNWKEDRFEHIKKNLLPFLKDTCAWDVEKQIRWVPVDGLKGVNISTKVDSAQCPWYKGDCLLDTFNGLPKIERPNVNVLRIPIFDKYKEKNECAFYGKVVSGAIKENMTVTIMPKGVELTITKIQDSNDEPLALAEAGDNIKVLLFPANNKIDLYQRPWRF